MACCGLDIFEYLNFISEGFVLHYLDDLLFSIFQLLNINWLVGRDSFVPPRVLSLELGIAGSYLSESLLKLETDSRDGCFSYQVWAALAETFLTSGSSRGMERTSSMEFQCSSELQRKSSPFHHKVFSISS